MNEKKKGLIGRIIDSIGDGFAWVAHLFDNAAKKMWESLPEEEQENLKNGSQLIAIINEHIDEAPEAIVEEIKKTAIGGDLSRVYDVYIEICRQFNLKPVGDTIEAAIASVQEYLKGKQGTIWEALSSALAQVAVTVLNGGKLGQALTSALIQLAYTKVKKED